MSSRSKIQLFKQSTVDSTAFEMLRPQECRGESFDPEFFNLGLTTEGLVAGHIPNSTFDSLHLLGLAGARQDIAPQS